MVVVVVVVVAAAAALRAETWGMDPSTVHLNRRCRMRAVTLRPRQMAKQTVLGIRLPSNNKNNGASHLHR